MKYKLGFTGDNFFVVMRDENCCWNNGDKDIEHEEQLMPVKQPFW